MPCCYCCCLLPLRWFGERGHCRVTICVPTLQTPPPPHPSPRHPLVVAVSLCFQVPPPRRDGGLRKDLRMETQYQPVSDPGLASLSSGNLAGDGQWLPVPVTRVGFGNTISLTVTGLRPASYYQFRFVLCKHYASSLGGASACHCVSLPGMPFGGAVPPPEPRQNPRLGAHWPGSMVPTFCHHWDTIVCARSSRCEHNRPLRHLVFECRVEVGSR
jgi:hypothetical protein